MDLGQTMERILASAKAREEDPERRREAEEQAAREVAQEQRRFERQRQENVAAMLKRADLPAKALDVLKAAQLPLLDTGAVKALEAPAVLTVLSGVPGCGKTVAAAGWLFRGIQEGVSGLFVSAAKLSRWGRYNVHEMDRLLEVGRLVVDDLGAEYLDDKGAYLSLFDEVVNERYAQERPLVLTTNVDATAFKARYGERIADRIRESGRFVSVGDSSMRRKAVNQ